MLDVLNRTDITSLQYRLDELEKRVIELERRLRSLPPIPRYSCKPPWADDREWEDWSQ